MRKILHNKVFYLILIMVLIFVVLSILGSIDRKGYLTNFGFIGTNDTDEYLYSFRISYYSKVFRNSDIYDVYPDLNNLPDYIKTIKIDKKGSPFGTLTSTKELKYDDKIDSITYSLKVKYDSVMQILFIILFIILFYLSLNIFIKYLQYKKTLSNQDYMFINILEILTICLFLFHYWLCYPGYFQYADGLDSMQNALLQTYDNWHPVIISLILNLLYKVFGYHSFYIYFINLSLWYVGLYIIVFTLYLKYNNKFVSLVLLITFLGNLFFLNIIHMKDITATCFLWFSCSIIFFTVNFDNLNNKTNTYLYIIMLYSILLAFLWRHNFIVTIYPIFICLVYSFLQNGKHIDNYIKYFMKFCLCMLIIAITMIFIHKSFPNFIIDSNKGKYASYNSFILQIAGCAVPANDGSMIPDYWYREGKTFEDVKTLYNKNKLNADQYYIWFKKERTFNSLVEFPELKTVWIKYIIKYPINYIKHILNYTKHIWTIKTWKYDEKTIQRIESNHYIHVIKNRDGKIIFDDYYIIFTPLQKNIYSFLYKILPTINILFFVILSSMLFFMTLVLWILKPCCRNKLLLFSFSTAFSAFATAIIVALFTPNGWNMETAYRYMHPVVPISIISLISFISFIVDQKIITKLYQKVRGK